MKSKPESFCLGGFSGVSNRMRQGTEKRISYGKFHMIFLWTIAAALRGNTGLICISMILALRNSDDAYKRIQLTTYRRHIYTPYKNLIFTKLCIQTLFASVITLWTFCIILLCGDVHLNPGPFSVDGSTDSSIKSYDSHLEMLSNHWLGDHPQPDSAQAIGTPRPIYESGLGCMTA